MSRQLNISELGGGPLTLLAVLSTIGLACKEYGSPFHETGPVSPPVVPPIASDYASFNLNGSKHVISIISEKNGYVANEIVIRCYGLGLLEPGFGIGLMIGGMAIFGR